MTDANEMGDTRGAHATELARRLGGVPLLEHVLALATHIDAIAVATTAGFGELGERVATLDRLLAEARQGQVEALDTYRTHVDEAFAHMRKVSSENNVELRSIAQRLETAPMPATDESIDRAVELISTAVASAGETATPPADPRLDELVAAMSETRASIDALAAAIQANAATVAQVAKGVRDVKRLAEQHAAALTAQSEPEAPSAGADPEVLDALSAIQDALAQPARPATAPEVLEAVVSLREYVEALPGEVAAAIPTPAPAPPRARSAAVELDTGPLVDEITAAVQAGQDAVLVEVEQLREEVVRLKRRLAVRSGERATRPATAGLDDADIDRIAQAVVAGFEANFEVLPDS